MKNLAISCLVVMVLGGCGYSTKSNLAGRYSSIYVDRFENKISFSEETARRNLYIPLLEVTTREELISRFVFDGNLSVADEDAADLSLRGVLNGYRRVGLRFTDNDDVQEYRVYITVGLQLWRNSSEEMLWEETGFVGEATYFVSGSEATSEDEAIDEAVVDLARRIVERVIEDW